MSKLYKQATLLVSRSYYHGGDGLENQGLRFFRSMEEYETEAEYHGWKDGKSFKSSWCTKPVEMEALVGQKDLARFEQGNPLSMDKVFFMSTLATKVHQVGGWQG
jgi:hypothetical protein